MMLLLILIIVKSQYLFLGMRDTRTERAQNLLIIVVMQSLHERPPYLLKTL